MLFRLIKKIKKVKDKWKNNQIRKIPKKMLKKMKIPNLKKVFLKLNNKIKMSKLKYKKINKRKKKIK